MSVSSVEERAEDYEGATRTLFGCRGSRTLSPSFYQTLICHQCEEMVGYRSHLT
jgi:hypothetical protein